MRNTMVMRSGFNTYCSCIALEACKGQVREFITREKGETYCLDDIFAYIYIGKSKQGTSLDTSAPFVQSLLVCLELENRYNRALRQGNPGWRYACIPGILSHLTLAAASQCPERAALCVTTSTATATVTEPLTPSVFDPTHTYCSESIPLFW